MLSACRPISESKVTNDTIELKSDYDTGLCWGAFAAIQRLSATEIGNSGPLLRACVPRDSTRTQLIAIFVRFAQKHPERYQEDFVFVTLSALKSAFPCNVNK